MCIFAVAIQIAAAERPGTAVFASGKRAAFDLKPAMSIPLTGTWTVDLAAAVGAPSKMELPALKSLSESDDAAVKYFSVAATYRTTVNVDAALLGADRRVELNLGDAYPDWFVKNLPRPETNRLAFVNWFYQHKDTPLIPSGLLGPVTFVPFAQAVLAP